ncbi:DnaJ domain-containing protein [Tsuneonella sp. YG55]|uniref:DnaJ domain-containing protein n=1 Tax=Tsuneonella litorea TaxID=2976475 RepID=A0A9X2W1M2_9SPHN|nr:DnaJ domain-containing protein [Tsuneonella litorea]MCT2559392.1 DnaJ domain-containing protein [Tsuneonella litorea]
MHDTPSFTDHYGALQVDFECDARRLELAYHYFAKLYHPDSGATANIEKFSEVVSAYKVLRDPVARAEYDEIYVATLGRPRPAANADLGQGLNGSVALNDAETHDRILSQLYKRRRENALSPGIVGWLLEESLGCTESQFEFHAWYLKSKGLMEITEDGTFAITVEGVDYVIARLRKEEEKKLLAAPAAYEGNGARGEAREQD